MTMKIKSQLRNCRCAVAHEPDGLSHIGLLVITFTLRASFAHSLKEKRACVKSLLAKLRGRFNVTVCEADAQDVHQLIVLRVAAFAGNHALADALYEAVCRFVEANTQAELIGQEQEYL